MDRKGQDILTVRLIDGNTKIFIDDEDIITFQIHMKDQEF